MLLFRIFLLIFREVPESMGGIMYGKSAFKPAVTVPLTIRLKLNAASFLKEDQVPTQVVISKNE